MSALLREPPVFVVGNGRSGTTLMRMMLAAHPRIAMTPETHFATISKPFGLGEKEAPDDPGAYIAALTGHHRFADLGIAETAFTGRLPEGEEVRFQDALSALLAAYAEKEGKPRAGEKSPSHVHHMALFKSWYRQARFVFMIRDPRAVVASGLTTPWIADQLSAKVIPRLSMRRLRAYHTAGLSRGWAKVYGGVLPRWEGDQSVLPVFYERLVAAPEEETRRVCAFLGEDWSPAMIEGRAQVRGAEAGAGYPGWNQAHEGRAAGAVSTDSVERWRERLSGFEKAAIESVCGDAMTALGYRPESGEAMRRAAGAAARQITRLSDAEERLRRPPRTPSEPSRFARKGALG
jgi:hypothetical protein